MSKSDITVEQSMVISDAVQALGDVIWEHIQYEETDEDVEEIMKRMLTQAAIDAKKYAESY